MERRKSKEVRIGNVVIGGDNPIAIQSMTNTKTEDVEATVNQIKELTVAGCDIIRSAVPTMEAAKAFKDIKAQIAIPIVADIHFDYKLAIAAMENGADKIRINPGNIGSIEKVKAVVDVAKEKILSVRLAFSDDPSDTFDLIAYQATEPGVGAYVWNFIINNPILVCVILFGLIGFIWDHRPSKKKKAAEQNEAVAEASAEVENKDNNEQV